MPLSTVSEASHGDESGIAGRRKQEGVLKGMPQRIRIPSIGGFWAPKPTGVLLCFGGRSETTNRRQNGRGHNRFMDGGVSE